MGTSSTPRLDDYPKLSRPVDHMKPEYDVVVVGSGYGAGVAASRMARAGKSVAVLEVGWEIRPGAFPFTLCETLPKLNISGSSDKHRFLSRMNFMKDPTRLFQLHLGDGQHVFKSHGLGGCSLINGGVFLHADKETLQKDAWPAEFRNDPTLLDKYYARASTMLEPTTCPEYSPPLAKSVQLRDLAVQLGCEEEFRQVPLTTSFREERNSTGVSMHPNKGTGQECTGLNDGSKKSVAVTYLADAWNWGTEMFCGCEVRFVNPLADRGGGYLISFVSHDSRHAKFPSQAPGERLLWVKAKEFCFLGAGAVGTTEILMRSRARGMEMSPTLGKRVSGNGDRLLFDYNGRTDVNGIARSSSSESRPGPTITSAIDNRSPGGGFLVQDGCIPGPFAYFIQLMLVSQTILFHFLEIPRIRSIRQMIASLKSLFGGPYTKGGAMQRTSTYLVMSHDENGMILELEDDRVKLRAAQPAKTERSGETRVEDLIFDALSETRTRRGYSYFYGQTGAEVTVHPLGGANMSFDGTGRHGTTNNFGEVFKGMDTEVYTGLICCDASVIPTSLGVNPLATICAVAERFVAHVAERSGWDIDLRTRNGKLDVDSRPMRPPQGDPKQPLKDTTAIPTGWSFTEFLEGTFRFEHELPGSRNGVQKLPQPAKMGLYLTVEILKMHGDSAKAGYTGACTGMVSCGLFSASSLRIRNGLVKFFPEDEQDAEGSVLRYDLVLDSAEGKTYILKGEKNFTSRIAFSVSNTWAAATTLDVTILTDGGAAVGQGRVHISWPNFGRQLRTFRCNEASRLVAVMGLLSFLVFWIRQLGVFFFLPLIPARYPRNARRHITISRTPKPRIVELMARDQVSTRLEVYEPCVKPGSDTASPSEAPIVMLPGVTGLGAEVNVYALPFLECNMVDYFASRGHRCYVLTPRWGIEARTAESSTVFDCRLDVAAALRHVGETEGVRPYVVGHCQGSVALAMGLLDGTIDSKRILGVTANSVFIHEVFAYVNSLKGATTLLIQLYEKLAGNFFPVATSKDAGVFQWMLDVLLQLYPVPYRRDLCTSTSCHRTSFGFGLLWNHENINRETHDNIHRFFTGTHTKLLKHVVQSGTRGSCLSNAMEDLNTAENVERLRGLPMLFISGSQNSVFDPETTLRDYNMLRGRFGRKNYCRFLPRGYGHLDPVVGKNAARDVYGKINEHLQWCAEKAQTGANGGKDGDL